MRSLKDKERIYLIAKIYLDLNGPTTARKLAEYINECPINIQTIVSSNKIAQMLKGHAGFKHTGTKVQKYEVR